MYMDTKTVHLSELKDGDKFIINGTSTICEFVRKDVKGIRVKNTVTGLLSTYPYCTKVFPIVLIINSL